MNEEKIKSYVNTQTPITGKILQVIMEKDGYYYHAMPIGKTYGFKCGKCLKGNILPDVRTDCRVCSASVNRVRFEEPSGVWKEWSN